MGIWAGQSTGKGREGVVTLELFFRMFFLVTVFGIIFIILKSLFLKLKWAVGCVLV
jgi:hypothetical protein